jgi:hypothetical protein
MVLQGRLNLALSRNGTRQANVWRASFFEDPESWFDSKSLIGNREWIGHWFRWSRFAM